MSQPDPASPLAPRPWYRRVGPGLITACVVIGPGSILSSSKVGAANGFSNVWVVVLAVVFMMVYTAMGARLGVVARESSGDLIAHSAGRWLAASIGIGVFFISAAFQFGNNLGVASAFNVYIKANQEHLPEFLNDYLVYGLVAAFNLLAIGFLFVFRNLYKALERLMMAFVALMLLSFAANLTFAFIKQPRFVELLQGFVPPIGQFMEQAPPIELLALVGTTFVITAAYFQTYLVRQKGWGKSELKSGLIDARLGAMIMALITLMIMSTSAAVFHDWNPEGVEQNVEKKEQKLQDVEDVAAQLKPLFGPTGQALFCLGLFSAAYSSFMVNSMIGGFILSDGLGLGSRPDQIWPKIMTTVVLLTGMGVAMLTLYLGARPVPAIVAAQAVTVLAAPLMAAALLWLTNRRDVMGADRNGPVANVLAGIGLLLLIAMAYYTATEKVWPEVKGWLDGSKEAAFLWVG